MSVSSSAPGHAISRTRRPAARWRTLLLLAVVAALVFAQAPPVTAQRTSAARTLLPIEGHPRLFFTAAELPALRAQAASTHRDIWLPILDYADSLLGTAPPETAPEDGGESDYRNFGNQLIPLAFSCVITGGADYCDLARTYLLTFAAWDQWDEDEKRDLGHAHMLFGSALAYDWLYETLGDDERAAVREALVQRADELYRAATEDYRSDWNNWWSRAYLQNHYWINHSAIGLAGLALWGDDTTLVDACTIHASTTVNLRVGPGTDFEREDVLPAGDEAAIEQEGTADDAGFTWWHLKNGLWVRADVVSEPANCVEEDVAGMAYTWTDLTINRLSRGRDFLMAIEDGSWHESVYYQSYQLAMTLPYLYNLRRLHGVDLLPHTYLQNYPYWRIYNYVPGEVEPVMAYGDFELDWGNAFGPQNVLRFTAAEYRDGHAEWMAQKLIAAGERTSTIWSVPWNVFEFLYYDPTVTAVAPDDLPQSRVFDDLSGVIWRTGWGGDDLVFALKAGAYGGTFAHNTFVAETYPWEAPCVESGCQFNFSHDHDDTNTFYLYKGAYPLAIEHEGVDEIYTTLHNSILIDNRGQYRPAEDERFQPEDLAGSDGFLEATASAPGFDYVASDATRRYKDIEAMEDVTRIILFVRPSYFVMLDNLASEVGHFYEWVSHFEGDDESMIGTDGTWIRAETDDGQLLGIDVLLPAPFQTETGYDGRPYVRVNPAAEVDDLRFLHLLYPTTAATWEQRPDVALVQDNGQAVAARLTHRDGSGAMDDILIAYDAIGTATQVGAYEFDGRAAVITHGAGGALDTVFVYGGTFLADRDSGRVLADNLDPAEPLQITYAARSVSLSGQITSAVTLYAPNEAQITVNGLPWPYTRSGDTVTLAAQ